MGLKRCLACAEAFRPSARVANQSYCGRADCQRERRRLWQQSKRQVDPDYRENQLQCQRRWREENSDYWKQYRAEHPEYEARNRERQHERNAARLPPPIAKMDEMPKLRALPTGTYVLTAVPADGVAKMDAWLVEITVISST